MVFDFLSEPLREPAECVIRMGASGEEITSLYPLLKEVTVDCSRKEAWVASLVFESRRLEDGTWVVQDDERIGTWEPVTIEAAFGSTTEEIMRGYVREVVASYPEEAGAATVTVECQDASLALDREHIRRNWGGDEPTADQTIFSEIVSGRHSLTPHPDNGSGQTGLVLNQDGTDIKFLQARARANAYELIFYPDTVYFGPMRLDAEPQATVMVYAGRDTNCLSINVTNDGHQPDQVAFDVADPEGSGVTRRVVDPDLPTLGTTPADSSGSGLTDFVWVMRRPGGTNEEELAGQALALANEASLRVKVEGELDGSLYGHVLRVGEPVPVDGVGETYGGHYYVDEVTHTFDANGYRQAFTLLRNATGDDL